MTAVATPRRERHSVSAVSTFTLTYRIFVREVITRARIIALSMLGIVVVVVGWAVGMSDSSDLPLDALDNGVHLTVRLGLTVVVPIVALVFAAGVLGNSRDDGTLVYLWLRPLRRWPIALGAYASALTIIAPLTIVPIVVSAILIDPSSTLFLAVLMSSAVAVVGYTGMFVLLGSLLRKSIVWGLAYIIIWEGIASSLGKAAARLSIRGYASSILSERTGVSVDTFSVSQAWGIAVPVAVAAVAIMLTAIRLDRVDVA